MADDCRISVEVAGPAEIMAYTAKPDDIRGLANWLVSQCVSHSGGIGGFLTKDIGNLIDYVTAPQTDIYGLFRKIIQIPCCTFRQCADFRTIKRHVARS